MTDPTSLEIHVSVQAARRTVGWRAVHLAAGMLGDTDMALVPAPPPALLRSPAPDLPALAAKLDAIIPNLAWELDGCEDCLEILRRDARRLAAAAT